MAFIPVLTIIAYIISYVLYFVFMRHYFKYDWKNPLFGIMLVLTFLAILAHLIIFTFFIYWTGTDSAGTAAWYGLVNFFAPFAIYFASTFVINYYNIKSRTYVLEYASSFIVALVTFTVTGLSTFFILEDAVNTDPLDQLTDLNNISQFKINGEEYDLTNSLAGLDSSNREVFYDSTDKKFVELNSNTLTNQRYQFSYLYKGKEQQYNVVLSDKSDRFSVNFGNNSVLFDTFNIEKE
jgi:hypothetical protein